MATSGTSQEKSVMSEEVSTSGESMSDTWEAFVSQKIFFSATSSSSPRDPACRLPSLQINGLDGRETQLMRVFVREQMNRNIDSARIECEHYLPGMSVQHSRQRD